MKASSPSGARSQALRGPAVDGGVSRTARLEIAPRPELAASALDFLEACARRAGMPQEALAYLRGAVAGALELVVSANAGEASTPVGSQAARPVAIEIAQGGGRLAVAILNRGAPVFLGGPGELPGFQAASRYAGDVEIQNLGRAGQRISLSFPLRGAGGETPIAGPPPAGIIPDGKPPGEIAVAAPRAAGSENLKLRRLGPGEEPALSRLFHSVYAYEYINEYVYYPEKLAEMLRSGKLVSIVAARKDGSLAGHVGLVRLGADPLVYEAALGVVDPRDGSSGLFRQVFARAMEEASRLPMAYCVFDFVTNHDLSQRHIERYGTCDIALFAGAQSRETQARLERLGLGPDPEGMDRYSILLSVLPRRERPFGREVALPEGLGETLGFLLKPLGLSWTPSPRFDPLPPGGAFGARFQPAQGSVVFDMGEPGRQAAERAAAEWRRLVRNGYEYAAVEAPLGAPGLGALYDLLAREGFFIAGFVPYRNSGRLGLRLQAVAPRKVAFDQIKVHSAAAKRLLEAVRQDYERNQPL